MSVEDEFFNSIVKSSTPWDRNYEDMIFILASEFRYTQEDIEHSEIPFLFRLLNARERSIKEQERRLKNNK